MNGENESYLGITEQLSSGHRSKGLEEFVAYYSNRMSYAEVEKLVARLQGSPMISDQSIWNIVTEQARVVSEQLRQEVAESLRDNSWDKIQVNRDVDIYSVREREILLFDDGIQVKGQQENRRKSIGVVNPEDLSSEEYRKASRVDTDVIMLEKSTGGYEYIVAPIGRENDQWPSLAQVVQAKIIQEYGQEESALNIVAITDGARSIRLRLLSIFGRAIVIILDWYHLAKKVREYMSMIAKNKQDKTEYLNFLFLHLWRGETRQAIDYLQNTVQAKNPERLNELIGYIQKHQSEIINYERRQKAGKTIGSGRVEKGVDQVVGSRQKHKGMSWSDTGSHALAILKAVELNGKWQKLWFPN